MGRLREANLPRHLEHPGKTRDRDKESAAPAATPASTPAPGGADAGPPPPDNVKEGELGSDPQLDHALELLKSWQVFKTSVARREG